MYLLYRKLSIGAMDQNLRVKNVDHTYVLASFKLGEIYRVPSFFKLFNLD